MYKKGDAQVEDGVMDSDSYKTGTWAFLPHSCDSWVIGGSKEIRAMIADLEALLPEMERIEGETPAPTTTHDA